MEYNNEKLKKTLLVISAVIFWPVTLIILPIIVLVNLAIKSEGDRRLALGYDAERTVEFELGKLDYNNYTILYNICLPSAGNTSTTQIDHIVVSNFGIFCIETKAHKGWIFGSQDQKYWTEVIYKEKYKFYNPLWQNYAHTKALESLLGDSIKAPIMSLVVFPNSDKIKISGSDLVGTVTEMLTKITKYVTPIYDIDERSAISNKIIFANIIDKDILKKHNDEVRNIEEY